MDIAEALAFIAVNHRGVLSTQRADGRPALTPVTAAVDDAGRVIVSTRDTAMKVHNIRHDAYVSLVVMSDTFFGPWVQIEGPATVLELPDAIEPLVDYYRRVAGEHADWDDYRRAMIRDRRVLLQIEALRVGPTRSG
jgi:PPOX class probable F420-dependent enzyme